MRRLPRVPLGLPTLDAVGSTLDTPVTRVRELVAKHAFTPVDSRRFRWDAHGAWSVVNDDHVMLRRQGCVDTWASGRWQRRTG